MRLCNSLTIWIQAGFEPDLPDMDEVDTDDVEDEEEEESVKIVRLVKRDEPLGATIKADNGKEFYLGGS